MLLFAIIMGYLCPNSLSEMTISYQWLLQYLPTPIPVGDLSNILTSIGLEVEAVETVESIKGGLNGLLIGEVLTCTKHPNADKLSVTTVNIGAESPVQIVCGAPNVATGQKVVVAPVGTTVHPTDGEPFLIKKAKIRGEESAGMICAEDEIGLGKSHDGIMILPPDAVVGTTARTYFGIPESDFAIHIGLTPNRSDANSHIGVARDVCAWLSHHHKAQYGVVSPTVSPASVQDMAPISVTILNPDACPRYTGLYIKNVSVTDSPKWLQEKLSTIGVRSINNVVDATNYVLHEYGQPLHAFDANKIEGNKIIVTCLEEGTSFIGLDDKERKLRAGDLMICDANGPIAMGGVFGGKDSGITTATTNVFLESAYFSPMHIRRSSLHHGLRTDAATHFEKGVDINNVLPALQRAATLITQIAGGQIAAATVDVYPTTLLPNTVNVSYNYIYKLSGKNYGKEPIKNILIALGFVIVAESDDQLTLEVPTNKPDVTQPADIVEEILRIDGLDNIAIPEKLNISLIKALPGDREMKQRIAQLLCGAGVQEIVTNSITNSKYYPEHTSLVRMINSLSSELDVMRPSMLESGLEVIQYNCNRKSTDLALFEFGNIYQQEVATYNQESRLAIWLTGNTTKGNWQQKATKNDIYYLKGLILNMMSYSGISNTSITYAETGAEIIWKWKNQTLCIVAKVTQERLNLFDIKQEVFFADINWDLWAKASASARIKYTEVPKFPNVNRDLAIVIDKQTTYQQVQDVTAQLKISELKSFGLFDIFESEKLGQDKKSYALNYTFQLNDRTLTDAETEDLMKKLSDAYKNKLGALIRE